MNPLEWINFIDALIKSESKVIAFFFAGIGCTIIGAYSLQRWVFPRTQADKLEADLVKKEAELDKKNVELADKSDRIREMEGKLDAREQQVEATRKAAAESAENQERVVRSLQEKVAELSKVCESLKEDANEQARQTQAAQTQARKTAGDFEMYKRQAVQVVTKYRKQAAGLNGQIATMTEQMQIVEQTQGRFWEVPPRIAIPPFRTRQANHALIVAVMNLKGGVGKTTLTANIAATLWTMGQRVLLIDLDNQASLTFSCLSYQQIKDLRQGGGRYVQEILKARAGHADVLWKNLERINDHGGSILATSEDLTDIEEHAKAQWLLRPMELDIRYLLRAALHPASVQERFDVILLDCPPRLTPASINALTASDCALIPSMLDPASTDAVPRLLALLRKFRDQNVCPDLSILGVVANRTARRAKLTLREQLVWDELPRKCKAVWGETVYHFQRAVPSSAHFATSAEARTFAAHHPDLEPIFSELVNELQQRKVSHESSRLAAVS